MKVFSVLISLLGLALSLHAQVISYQELPRPASKPGLDIYFYFSSPGDEVIIENGKLTHIAKKQIYDQDRPWVATPAGVSRQAVADAVPLNGHQLNSLREMIHSSGFLGLPQSEYGAPSDQRSNLYQMYIRSQGSEKKIIYYHSPSSGQPPAAFRQLKEYIWSVVARVEQ